MLAVPSSADSDMHFSPDTFMVVKQILSNIIIIIISFIASLSKGLNNSSRLE